MHTLKPLDHDAIAEVLNRHRRVVVVEEMAPYGGLGPRVKEIAWDIRADCRLDTFGLQDEFIHNYGSQDQLHAAHGLDIRSLSKILDIG